MASSWLRNYGSSDVEYNDEGDPYQQAKEADPLIIGSQEDNKTPHAWLTISLCFLLLITAILATTNYTTPTVVVKEEIGGGSCLPEDYVSLSVNNEYGEYSSIYPTVEINQNFVEPYKNSSLMLSGLDNCIGYRFSWACISDDGIVLESSTSDNPQTNMILKETGTFTLTVIAIQEGSDTKIDVYSGKLKSRYVKRELRKLTPEDKKRFLDAAAVLWQIDTTTGRQLYGEKYTSVSTFVEEHALASNDIRCDAYHEGSGFITHHLALQNSFDASLRAVDPSVTTPYWDFTIEGQVIAEAGMTPSYLTHISPVFTDEWFGRVDENDHIVDSRWAHIRMPRTSSDSVVAPNSYGYVRSYWNNNNDPEVTRHLFDVCGVEPVYKTVPACGDHYGVISSPTLGLFQMTSPGYGHGPLHVLTGGVGGQCVQGYADLVEKWKHVLYANISEQEILAKGFEVKKVRQYGEVAPRMEMINRIVMGEYFHIYRSLWRSHMCSRDSTPQLLHCPEHCSPETPLSECTCSVPGLNDGTVEWEDVFYCVVNSDRRPYFEAFMPRELLKDLVYFVSNTPLVEGEMLEAASPADIMFWMIHPAIERLLTAKRLSTVDRFGDKIVSKWTESAETWLTFSYYTQGEGDNPTYPAAYTCVGHAPTDPVLPDSLPLTAGFAEKADTDRDGVITNWEFYTSLDPNLESSALDYVFDDFVWNHCSDSSSTQPIDHTETDHWQ